MTTTHVTGEDQIVAYHEGEHSLEDNFRRFHADNPHVYETLVILAHDWRRRLPGRMCGIGMLYEVTRWELDLRGEGEPVALNNNYRSFYSRLIMDSEPGLEGLFEVRRQRGLEGANPVAFVPGFAPSSPSSSQNGGAGGLAAASAARTAEAPAPSEDAAAGNPISAEPAAAQDSLFDLPSEPAWA